MSIYNEDNKFNPNILLKHMWYKCQQSSGVVGGGVGVGGGGN